MPAQAGEQAEELLVQGRSRGEVKVSAEQGDHATGAFTTAGGKDVSAVSRQKRRGASDQVRACAALIPVPNL
jgi:hypothetical protein